MQYVFTLETEVHDAQALRRAAVAHYVAENPTCCDDADEVFGTDAEPNVGACLVQLLDPGRLDGCSIDYSTASDTADLPA